MKRNNKIFDGILLFLGILSMLYFFILLGTISFGFFLLIYPLFSIGIMGIAIFEILHKKSFLSIFSKWIRRILVAFVSFIILVFLILEGRFLHQSLQSHQNASDFVIVLGAQVRGSSLSPSLKYRLDATLSYYYQHPTTTIIVSGGQGIGEDDSEANIMKQYLVKQGIPSEKILMEDQSTSTYENLLFTKKILDTYQRNYTVTIITNGFHCYRALYIAKKLGYDAYTYAAKEHAISTPHYYIREFFAYLKDAFLSS